MLSEPCCECFHSQQFFSLQLGGRFAEAQNVPIGIFNVEIPTRPWSLFQRLSDERSPRSQFIMQSRHANYPYVNVEMFMLLAMRPVSDRLRRAFQMNSKTVTTDAGIERLVAEVQFESELLLVIGDGCVKIVHQKLRC